MISYFFEGVFVLICPSKFLYGIPCPGCGLTRSFVSLLHGKWITALYYNMNIVFIIPLGIIFVVLVIYDVIFHDEKAFFLYKQLVSLSNNVFFFIPFIVFEFCVWVHSFIHQI